MSVIAVLEDAMIAARSEKEENGNAHLLACVCNVITGTEVASHALGQWLLDITATSTTI